MLGRVFECIYCPCTGTVEKILTVENNHVYEWEKLFVIRTVNGTMEEISVGISGHITSLHVSEGEFVQTNSVLATIKDDLIISGCD